MKLETFLEKFDQLADAPNAITKMRELVLQLAFTGGLSGKHRDENGLPQGWKKLTIESICASISPGFACSRSHQVEGGHVHLRTHNISTLGTLNFDLLVRIEPTKVEPQKSSIRRGDILFNNTNSQELVGKTCLVDKDYDYGFSNHITRLRLKDDVLPGFVVFYLTLLRNSGYFARLCTRWINQAAVNTETLKKQIIPLPSLAEQKRIVAKVGELMALCDRLESQQQERDTRHAALARASLARFAEAPTPANLDFLFHNSYTITPADLRKSILTLAVQGKLVPQNPNDEPVQRSFLGLTPLPFESNDNKDIPDQWELCTYRSLTSLVTSGSRGWKEFYSQTGAIFVRTQNIKTDKLVLDDVAFVELPKSAEGMRAQVLEDDILITITGANVTKAARVEEQIPEAYVSQHIALTRPRWPEMSKWLHLCFISHGSARGALEQLAYGDKPGLNLNNIRDLVLLIPPLAEQRRIVAKVDQLMALVDRLEVQLFEAKAKSAVLLDAIIHELLNPTAEVIDLASYRAAIGCYAIGKMKSKRYFGRTTAMKVFYLAQAHVGLKLDLQPMREAAGPLDSWIYRFEEDGEREDWFKAMPLPTTNGKSKIEYRTGRTLAEKSAQAERIFTPDQHREFDRLLALFADKTTEEVEIIATLFAAWNDFLIDGHTPSDDEIVTEVREHWHEKKGRFSPTQLRQWLDWLRRNNLIPQGRLPHTVHQPQLSLNSP